MTEAVKAEKECSNCSNILRLDVYEKPDTDWLKIVCSNCGTVHDLSMIRQYRRAKVNQNNGLNL